MIIKINKFLKKIQEKEKKSCKFNILRSSIMNLIMNKIWKLFQLYIFWFYIFIAFIWIFKFFYITSICWVMDNWNNLYFCRLKHGVRNELHKSGCYLATRYEKCKVNTFSESLWHRDEVDIWLVRAEEIVLDTILRFLNFLRNISRFFSTLDVQVQSWILSWIKFGSYSNCIYSDSIYS